jgi:hypothetical protein|nr:MAG TPA: hypothetical protein [Inoviridae sp.]
MLTGIANIIVPLVKQQELVDMLIQNIGMILALLLLCFVLKH